MNVIRFKLGIVSIEPRAKGLVALHRSFIRPHREGYAVDYLLEGAFKAWHVDHPG
ncbi:hypothetical protein D3C84_1100890 [compost metagenome]